MDDPAGGSTSGVVDEEGAVLEGEDVVVKRGLGAASACEAV